MVCYKYSQKDKRYEEYIANISDEDMSGGMYMDMTLNRLIEKGKTEGKIKKKQG